MLARLLKVPNSGNELRLPTSSGLAKCNPSMGMSMGMDGYGCGYIVSGIFLPYSPTNTLSTTPTLRFTGQPQKKKRCSPPHLGS